MIEDIIFSDAAFNYSICLGIFVLAIVITLLIERGRDD